MTVSVTSRGSDLPRSVCSSVSAGDNFWASSTLLYSVRDPSLAPRMTEECQVAWSPGLVVYVAPAAADPTVLLAFASLIRSTSHRLGKARRIVCGTFVNRELAKLLYKSFYCVEYANVQGTTTIVDDGNESVVMSDLIGIVEAEATAPPGQ